MGLHCVSIFIQYDQYIDKKKQPVLPWERDSSIQRLPHAAARSMPESWMRVPCSAADGIKSPAPLLTPSSTTIVFQLFYTTYSNNSLGLIQTRVVYNMCLSLQNQWQTYENVDLYIFRLEKNPWL